MPLPCVQEAGVSNARLKLYKGKTHTKPIVEDPSEWSSCSACGAWEEA